MNGTSTRPLSTTRIHVLSILILLALIVASLPATTSVQASPATATTAGPPLAVGTWNTMLHPWFPYQADVIKEIGKTSFDVLALQEVWTDAAKTAIVSDPQVKANYPYSYYAPAAQQLSFCSLDIPRSELEDLISVYIISGTDPRTAVQPDSPVDPFAYLLQLSLAFRDEQQCLECIYNTVQSFPADRSPFEVIDECYFFGGVKYSHGGSPGLLVLSKQPLENVQPVGYDTFMERRVIVYATIAGARFAFTQFPYNYFENIQPGAGYLQPGALQPQMAQDLINAQPDYIVGDFNSGPNFQPEGHNLLVANGYHALTDQITQCPVATHAAFVPCQFYLYTEDQGDVLTVQTFAVDNIYVKQVPACFTPGTFARQPISDHIGLSICNTAPLAKADAYSVNQGGSLSVATPGVLGNDKDSDPQNDPLTATLVSGPAHATSFKLNPDGSFTYTPNATYGGIDSFTYKANDGIVDSPTVTVTISVGYRFKGFLQPVDNLPTLNNVKAGSAVPVKFSLSGNQGVNIFAAGYPKSQPISCSSGASDDVEETSTASTSSLQYDAATDTYTYVWKTEKSWAGTCRQLIVRLADGTDHVANFKFK